MCVLDQRQSANDDDSDIHLADKSFSTQDLLSTPAKGKKISELVQLLQRSPRVARVSAVETAPLSSTQHSHFDQQCKGGRPDKRRRDSSEGQSVNNDDSVFRSADNYFSAELFSTPAKVFKKVQVPRRIHVWQKLLLLVRFHPL